MLKITGKGLSLNDVNEILLQGKKISIDPLLMTQVEESYLFLQNFSKNKVIYGINTGLGPMAQYRVKEEDTIQLQLNLIRSHCAGTGNPLTFFQAKACLLARLSSFLQGKSAVHPSTVTLLTELINQDVVPVIYEHGGVGASGDLVQLAHVALFLIGEGEAIYQNKILPAKEVFVLLGITPLQIHLREGLAIMNGTSTMTGIGLTNLLAANRLLSWSLTASVLINELVESFDDHFSATLNTAKAHKGQQEIALAMRSVLKDSQLVKKRDEHLYTDRTDAIFEEKVQEYYSIRCVPQILGPIYDTLKQAEITVVDELNSANDNPVIDVKAGNVYHGGNFHGDYVALEMDKIKIALTKLAMLSERQSNYLLNSKLNEKFPPFLNMGILGLNLGLQGLQFTATSTTAECQTLSYPMYVHSIPNNGDNQDIVSMGTNAALLTAKVIDNAYQVVAIQLMMIVQAVEIAQHSDKLSSFSKKVVSKLREVFQPSKTDRTFYLDIKNVKEMISQHSFLEIKRMDQIK